MRTKEKTKLTVMLFKGGLSVLCSAGGDVGFGGTGQQQDLLCIIVGHKAILRTYRLAQAGHKGGEFMEMCATQCFSMEKSRWAALGAFKLGDG